MLAALALVMVAPVVSACGDDSPEKNENGGGTNNGGGNSGGSVEWPSGKNSVDSEWEGWKLTGNDYSWPESKRIAEEKKFTFSNLPTSKNELLAICAPGSGLEQRITSPHMAAALCYAALCNCKNDPDATLLMYRWLKGPDGVSKQEWQNISTRLKSKQYITYAMFEGATPLNDYTPSKPYTIIPYTQKQGNGSGDTYIDYGTYTETDGVVYCKVFVHSGGADSPVPIMTKFHRASGNWFISGSAYVALTDIRTPSSQGGGY